MIPAIRWLIHQIGGTTLLVVILLLLTLGAIAQGIAGLVRVLDIRTLYTTLLIGVLLSWLLAKTRIRGWLAVSLMYIAGGVIVITDVGQLGGRFFQIYQRLVDVDAHLRLWVLREPVDIQNLLDSVNQLLADITTLILRLNAWLVAMFSNHSIFDPVAASIVWSLALWVVSTWAAWAIRRRMQALSAMLPAIVLLTAIYAYTGVEALLLAWPAFTLLILMVVVSHTALEKHWRNSGIDYSEDIGFDIALIVIPISTVLVAVAWFTPSISIQDISNTIQEAMRGPAQQVKPLPDSLGLQAMPEPVRPVAAPKIPGLPRSHLIGAGPELSHETVMIVNTGDLPPMPQYTGAQLQQPARYYWRGLVYDRYTGAGWVTSATKPTDYLAGKPVFSSTLLAQRVVRQEVTLKADLDGLIYRSGTLISADADFHIQWRSDEDDFTATFARPGDDYYADSLISTASAEQLRTVPSVYSDWITERYLQLPENTPQRVLKLARDLTATSPTPYDRAVAIESYLRTYSYTLDLPAPPVNRDVADYFLFDLKRGYCDYFATAMIVLARAAGLPARMVVGYASGTYDPIDAYYIVTQADAHSWPEVYFNQYGWVEFEPTSGRAPIAREDQTPTETASSKSLAPLEPRHTLLDALDWLLPLAFVLLLVGGVPLWLALDSWALARKQPGEVIELLFVRLYAQGQKLTVWPQPGSTPHEYASALIQRVTNLAPYTKRGAIGLSMNNDVSHLEDLFVRTAYSCYLPDSMDKQLSIQAWQRVRFRLWQAWLWRIRSYLSQSVS